MRITFALLLAVAIVLCLLPDDVNAWRSRRRSQRPIMKRRYSLKLMGRTYFGYVSLYPNHFNHKLNDRPTVQPEEHDDDDDDDDEREANAMRRSKGICLNNLALANGSRVGYFRCPFLNSENRKWTKCCGYNYEEFCCDPNYDDSWAHKRKWTTLAIVCITSGLFMLVVVAIAAMTYWHCRTKARARVGASAVTLPERKAVQPMAPAAEAAPLPEKLHPDQDPNFGMANPIFFTSVVPPQTANPPSYGEQEEAAAAATANGFSEMPPAYTDQHL